MIAVVLPPRSVHEVGLFSVVEQVELSAGASYLDLARDRIGEAKWHQSRVAAVMSYVDDEMSDGAGIWVNDQSAQPSTGPVATRHSATDAEHLVAHVTSVVAATRRFAL